MVAVSHCPMTVSSIFLIVFSSKIGLYLLVDCSLVIDLPGFNITIIPTCLNYNGK